MESPCEKKWADLSGEGEKRHCEACALHVIDGSALTKAQAESVVKKADASGERVCMRMLVDGHGGFVHAEEPPTPQKSLGWKAGAVLVSSALVACGDAASEQVGGADPSTAHEVPSTERPPERPPEILGDICYVEEPEEPGLSEEPRGMEGESLEGHSLAQDPNFTEAELLEMMGGMRIAPELTERPEGDTVSSTEPD
ncbi:MAG: hypothetical protein AAGG01_06790 [Planctomycetota bacterium]